jgi:hypothetical protein
VTADLSIGHQRTVRTADAAEPAPISLIVGGLPPGHDQLVDVAMPHPKQPRRIGDAVPGLTVGVETGRSPRRQLATLRRATSRHQASPGVRMPSLQHALKRVPIDRAVQLLECGTSPEPAAGPSGLSA